MKGNKVLYVSHKGQMTEEAQQQTYLQYSGGVPYHLDLQTKNAPPELVRALTKVMGSIPSATQCAKIQARYEAGAILTPVTGLLTVMLVTATRQVPNHNMWALTLYSMVCTLLVMLGTAGAFGFDSDGAAPVVVIAPSFAALTLAGAAVAKHLPKFLGGDLSLMGAHAVANWKKTLFAAATLSALATVLSEYLGDKARQRFCTLPAISTGDVDERQEAYRLQKANLRHPQNHLQYMGNQLVREREGVRL